MIPARPHARFPVRGLPPLLVGAAALAAAGCDLLSSPSPEPTTVTVAPASLEFDAVGDTAALTVEVLDQNDRVMEEVEVAWSSSNPSVAEVSPGGRVTSEGNGEAVVTATAGAAAGQAQVAVSQTIAVLEVVSGEDQQGPVGEPLPDLVRVRATDRLGRPARGRTVVFEVVDGDGSVEPAEAETGPDGLVDAAWTLGTLAGAPQQLRIAVPGGDAVGAEVEATARPGPSAEIVVIQGDGQQGHRVLPLDDPLVVRVEDRYGNPVEGTVVAFRVESGGGSVDPGSVETDGEGLASAVWTLGEAVGGQTLSASADSGPSVTFSATGRSIPATLQVLEGNAQTGPPDARLPEAPTVRVLDEADLPAPDVEVEFTVASGGGALEPPGGGEPTTTVAVEADGDGVAGVGGWILGPSSGAQTVTATAVGEITATFTATALVEGGDGEFTIELQFLHEPTPSQRAAFEEAASRWEEIIVGSLDPRRVQFDEGWCGDGSPAMDRIVDDLLVLVFLQPIDGPGGTLAAAGPCAARDAGAETGALLPVVGRVRVDTDDIDRMEEDGRLVDVLTHEIAHAMGFGIFFQTEEGDRSPWWTLVANRSFPGNRGADTHFFGPSAIEAFDAVGGDGYTGGAKVPLESEFGGGGTRDRHWRATVFGNELLIGFLTPGASPLSRVTIAAFRDMGYQVDEGAADPYSLDAALRVAEPGEALDLGEDVLGGPIHLIDEGGRPVGVVHP